MSTSRWSPAHAVGRVAGEQEWGTLCSSGTASLKHSLFQGSGRLEALLEILGIPLLSARHKQMLVFQLPNQAVLNH